jgi:hypothetical protein
MRCEDGHITNTNAPNGALEDILQELDDFDGVDRMVFITWYGLSETSNYMVYFLQGTWMVRNRSCAGHAFQ